MWCLVVIVELGGEVVIVSIERIASTIVLESRVGSTESQKYHKWYEFIRILVIVDKPTRKHNLEGKLERNRNRRKDYHLDHFVVIGWTCHLWTEFIERTVEVDWCVDQWTI